MNASKPNIGRPAKFVPYLAKLDDETLYTPTAIATLLHQWAGVKKSRVQKAMIQRAKYHFMEPDGFVSSPKGQLAAYTGKQWKATLDPVRFSECEEVVLDMAPLREEEHNPEDRSTSRGPSIKYDHFVRHLKAFETYSPKQVVEHGLKRDLVSKADPMRLEAEKVKAGKAIRAFSARLPERDDNPKPGRRGAGEKAWYGWRWQLALPDNAFTDRQRRKLERRLRVQHFFSKPKMALMLVLGVSLGVVFAIGPTRLLDGGRILREKGPQAAYQFFLMEPVETDQSLFGRAWTAFRNQQYAEAIAIADRLLKVSVNENIIADTHYLLGNMHSFLGAYAVAKAELEVAADQYERLGKARDQHQALLGMARIALNQVAFDSDEQEGLLREAQSFLDLAFPLVEQPYTDFYHLQSRIAFFSGDYPAALGQSQTALALAEDDPFLRGEELLEVGFLSMLMGQYESGMEMTREAEGILFDKADNRTRVFGLLNHYLYLKCIGRPSKVLSATIEESARMDPTIRQFFEYTKHCSCAPENRPSPGNPEPPTSMGGGGGGGGGKN